MFFLFTNAIINTPTCSTKVMAADSSPLTSAVLLQELQHDNINKHR